MGAATRKGIDRLASFGRWSLIIWWCSTNQTISSKTTTVVALSQSKVINKGNVNTIAAVSRVTGLTRSKGEAGVMAGLQVQ
jgi:hypothetical protein